MEKYFFKINDNEFEGIIGENSYEFEGAQGKFEYKFLDKDLLLLRYKNRNFIIKNEELEEDDSKNTEFQLEMNSEIYNISSKNELDILTEKFSKSRGEVKIKNELISPMPGAIVKIKVKEGDEVKKGDVLIVLEAMKMENELKATNDCKIGKILVEEKMPVDKNQLLIKFEI